MTKDDNINIISLNWWANNKFSLYLSNPSNVIIKHSTLLINIGFDKIYIPGIIILLFWGILKTVFFPYNSDNNSFSSFGM